MQGGEWKTPKIAAMTSYSNSSCYSACRRLEEKELISSNLRIGGRVFWDPVTRLVQTKNNFDYIKTEREDAMNNMKTDVKKKFSGDLRKSQQSIQDALMKILVSKVKIDIKDYYNSATRIRELLEPVINYDIHNWWLNKGLLKSLSLIMCLLIYTRLALQEH